MSSNQAAIVLGVQKWLESNKDLVERCLITGAERGVEQYAIEAGAQTAARVEKWMKENKTELITALAGQIAIGALSEVPGLSKKLQEEKGQTVDTGEKNEG